MKCTKNKSSLIVATVLTGLAGLSSIHPAMASDASAKGKCYGVAGPEEGDCGGKDPKTGESWSCAGNNPTADLGWKKMTKAECDAAEKHATATKKNFVANK
jgi:uncharacterized membrane protein